MPNTSPVFAFLADLRPAGPRWCVLRAALPGDRITTLCADAVDYSPVCVSTRDPGVHLCPACRAEIGAGTPGSAVALEPDEAVAEPDSGRVATVDLRRPATGDPAKAWEPSWDPPSGAPDSGPFDHLADLRDVDLAITEEPAEHAGDVHEAETVAFTVLAPRRDR